MSKNFKKGDRVWIAQYIEQGVLEVELGEQRPNGEYLAHNPQSNICALDENCPMFATKQECIDYITNSIKVIPYEDTTSV